MPIEIKKATSYEEQIEILKKHGCYISDEVFCRQKLEEIKYYRLSAYFLPFKNSDDKYEEGTSFHSVYRIYEFDRKLRGILFSAVEDVEVYLRSSFSYFHAHKYGALGYEDPANFSKRHNHNKFEENYKREISNNIKVPFVKHHIENYDGKFPIWALTELFSFGMLSYFYDDLKTADQKILSSELYRTIPKNVISWLRCCTVLRNTCAHYGRLYYRIFPAMPSGFEMTEAAKRRLWGTVMSLRALYPNTNKWNSEVLTSIENLFEEYHGDISLYHIAFPDNWIDQLRK